MEVTVVSARVGVTVAFALNGGVYSSWAVRVPALAGQVSAGPGELGIALLGTAVGMALGANSAGRLAAGWGARRTVLTAGSAMLLLVPVLGLVRSVWALGLALVALGLAVAAMDVAMNVGAVQVTRRLDRPLMPVFHAWFSFGGLFGSVGAGAAAAVGLPVLGHLALVAVVGLVALHVLCRAVPDDRPEGAEDRSGPRPARRPVLWVLGVITLCSGLAEGASTDWSALLLVREREVSQGAAAVAFGAFSVAMALTRLSGERLERRFGPYRLLTVASVVAGVGLLTAALVPAAWSGYLGFGLAGAGLAFCFPVGLSLAGAAGHRADGGGGEREIGFVAGIAYTGFLAGPPLVGGIAAASNLAVSFVVVALVVAAIPLAARGAAALREREPARVR